MEQTRTKFSLSKCGAVVGSPLRKRLSSFGPKKFKRSSRFTIKDVPQFNITKSLTNLGHYASFGTYLGQIWDICVIKGGLPLKALSWKRGSTAWKNMTYLHSVIFLVTDEDIAIWSAGNSPRIRHLSIPISFLAKRPNPSSLVCEDLDSAVDRTAH